MDYSLAALKLMCAQLKVAKLSENMSFTLGGILFQRAWVQGIIVSISDDGFHFTLDDGSSLIDVVLSLEFINQCQWLPGMYVMVVGVYFIPYGEGPKIKVHKILDLSAHPDREAMWYLEAIEAVGICVPCVSPRP